MNALTRASNVLSLSAFALAIRCRLAATGLIPERVIRAINCSALALARAGVSIFSAPMTASDRRPSAPAICK